MIDTLIKQALDLFEFFAAREKLDDGPALSTFSYTVTNQNLYRSSEQFKPIVFEPLL